MSALEIKKCALCGKLFHSLGTNICAPCSEQADQDFLTVREYMYEISENASLNDIIANTGVSEKVVLFLMKDGRLSNADASILGCLKCAVCGVSIDSGKLCKKCSNVWSDENSKLMPERLPKQKSPDDRLRKGNKMHINHSSRS